jgi:hypothetical protein
MPAPAGVNGSGPRRLAAGLGRVPSCLGAGRVLSKVPPAACMHPSPRCAGTSKAAYQRLCAHARASVAPLSGPERATWHDRPRRCWSAPVAGGPPRRCPTAAPLRGSEPWSAGPTQKRTASSYICRGAPGSHGITLRVQGGEQKTTTSTKLAPERAPPGGGSHRDAGRHGRGLVGGGGAGGRPEGRQAGEWAHDSQPRRAVRDGRKEGRVAG